MRHGNAHTKLSMRSSHRKATVRNMARSLLQYQRIETIHARAKVVRRLAEHLITLAKENTVAARRRAYAILTDRDLVSKLFNEIGPLFKERKSGYTRIIPLGYRRGDGASLSILELTEQNIIEKITKKKEKKAAIQKERAAKAETRATAHTSAQDKAIDKKEITPGTAAHATAEAKAKPKDELKIKTLPKAKPTLVEEKKTERAKTEEKKIAGTKNFMKNLRGLFRKRGDR